MYLILTVFFFLFNSSELIIGEEKVDPGIVFIFEGAVKDRRYPSSFHLPESQTDVHIEARVNWDNEKIPEGGSRLSLDSDSNEDLQLRSNNSFLHDNVD